MTKLEEKLLELGYEFDHYEIFRSQNAYRKFFGDINCAGIFIYTNKSINKIVSYYAINGVVTSQIHIDNLQQAFNELQRDLEVLKEYDH